MTRYLARRVAFALFLVVAVSSASLVLARLAPGDFVAESLGTHASREAMAQQRARLGLDKSIAGQYRDWLAAAARLDFGESMQYGRPVSRICRMMRSDAPRMAKMSWPSTFSLGMA